MKGFFVVCFLGLVALAASRYTDKYDNIDLDEILSNDRILDSYVKCMLDQGKCSPEGKELKSHLQEALENHCAECTETQVKGTKQVIKHFINKKPEIWEELCDKYDPKRIYSTKYEEELREITSQ